MQNDQIMTTLLSRFSCHRGKKKDEEKTERTAYYLFARAATSRSGMQIPSSLSHVASLGGARELLFFPRARKAPVYYLNNGSRARIIVSFVLSQRVTLLVTGERQRGGGGVGLFCFESRKKTERADGGRRRKGVKFRAG